jgi:hypothetical protein
MTTEDYVSYPLALALKKHGFDEPCRDFYWPSDGTFKHTDAPVHKNSEHCTTMVAAPTLWQTQKWLREEWGIHVNVCIYSDYSTDADGKVCDRWDFWGFDLYAVSGGDMMEEGDGEYDTYESALSAGIAAALELIEKKGE